MGLRVSRLRVVALGVVALVLASSPLAVEAASPDWGPDVADSSTLTGSVVASGRVIGVAAVSGSQVVLLAWPRQDVLSSMVPGDSFKLVPVGKALVGSDGSFDLRIDPKANMDEFLESDGRANLDIRVTSAAGMTTYGLPVQRDSQGRVSSDPSNVVIDARAGATPPAQGSQSVLAPTVDKWWTETLVLNYVPQWDVVGELYTGPHATGTFRYQVQASTTLGIGVSATGAFGSWSSSGTVSWAINSTQNFGSYGINSLKVLQTKFQYGKYRESCFTEFGPCGITYQTRVNQFVGGTNNYNTPSAPTATMCTTYLAGTGAETDTATAVTFSNGMSMGSQIGVDLSTRSGFSTTVKLSWTYVTAGSLCGTNNFPPTANRVVAK